MSYYISTTIKNTTFKDAIEKTTSALKEEGFGVLTEIDLKATLKKKLDADFTTTLFSALATHNGVSSATGRK